MKARRIAKVKVVMTMMIRLVVALRSKKTTKWKKGEENSNDEKGDVFSNEDKEIDERPIGANNEEWKAYKRVH